MEKDNLEGRYYDWFMEVEFELSAYGLLIFGPRGRKELLPGEYSRSSNTHEGIKFSNAASKMKREEM